jgi:hypothetical protein
MELQFSEDFKKKFLFIFTKELINNSGKKDMIKLQSIVEEKRKIEIPIKKEIPKQIIQIKPQPIFRREISEPQKIIPKKIETRELAVQQPIQIRRPATRPTQNQILFIPEPTLPKHLEYLKPTASSPAENIEIDLGKLNPLLKDPAVKIIEGSPDERVRVMGTMGTRYTDIFMSKEDIEIVINKFSELSKIPTIEGIYRVVVGNLNLSAIISEVIGSRFVIKKISSQQPQQAQQIIPKK